MSKYIEVNNKFVNLSNVSTINFLASQNRVVLNFAHPIEISKLDKMISEYTYIDFDTDEQYETYIKGLFLNKYIQAEYISKDFKGELGLINKSKISSFKFEAFKNKVIFNMNHAISVTNKYNQYSISTEFVYVNCESHEYEKYVNYVKSTLLA